MKVVAITVCSHGKRMVRESRRRFIAALTKWCRKVERRPARAGHVGKIPGIQEYAIEFTSNKAMGEDGYLPERGLIPLPDDELEKVEAKVKALTPMKM